MKKLMINLYNGDTLEIMDKLIEEGVVVDAIITDPPYGTTACKWDSIIPFDAMWERLNKLIKPNGAIVLFGAEPFSSALRMSNIKNYKYDWIWNKKIPTGMGFAKYQPMRVYENILLFNKHKYSPQMEEKDKPRKYTSTPSSKKNNEHNYGFNKVIEYKRTHSYPKNIIEFSNADRKNRVHPTQKPVELMEYLIKTYTNEGELVLDFTMGSGSTGVACVNTNRSFIGIELDEKYFEICKERINSN